MRSALNIGLCLLLSFMTLTGYGQTRKKKTTKAKPKAKTTATRAVGPAYSATQQLQVRKSFFLLYILERKGPAHDLIVKNTTLNAIARERQLRLTNAYSQCADAACISEALRWTEAEIRETSDELKKLAMSDNGLAALVERLKIESRYPVYNNDADTTFIRKAWEDVATGMNHIFKVYLAGKPPRYPKIDSISFRPTDPVFVQRVKTATQQVLAVGAGNTFFKQPLLSALKALEINGRDEAVRYEPLYKGNNAAPFAKSRRIYWNAYKYSAILVPGSGPGKPGRSIDSMGAYRCGLAAEQYKQRLAPFIIVSGGHVHPYKTPFCEAIEMKKYLVGKLGVPDSAVIIEPHARHTTTNIRNAVRLTYLFNMPSTKPMLIVSDSFQSLAIEKMAIRFINELGYLPYNGLERRSNTENVIRPDLRAWQQDPEDPLDP
ncbi:YdcF family protein [Chitinophaga rhizophila]|uniref:YdcF family protein n=1 Tax=Chitinophaga rhizophila TaxID=2866212 RepID=A0ABS7GJL9_9BACT|nr:YdcF family protein [Chitinophaga rhizophila]MBW8686852.1 YdcF family protein [Chitinophaga rhizophila]